ncbi:MAG TPA: putative inorganic carbon transporter subunit DabA, partial [Kofleriaceae bacterium]|nr:putative inorganic carbon transporter subunit DabA [Kofleriaceae bacterium]
MTELTLKAAVERACASIAPTWPLDRFIAVNPFWPRTDKPLPQVAGELAALSGARLLMPRAWYAAEWRAGRLGSEHVREAIAETGADVTEDDLIASFWIPEPKPTRRPLVVDVLETLRRSEHELSWREFVMERISRFCASYFDDGQAQVSAPRGKGFYATWRSQADRDHMPALFMGLDGYRATLDALPLSANEMIDQACTDLGVPAAERERYFAALLLDVNGWASWCAYLRWTARLAGGDDGHIRELLAIRLAWEWLLLRSSDEAITAEWRFAMTSWAAIDRAAQLARSDDWILQRAVELAWLSRVRPKLPQGFDATRPAKPRLQAAFCIDVRSEVFRRALEAQGDDIQTFGAAGFFGMPIEYAQLAADDARPQLPGLLAPKYRVVDTNVPKGLETTRRARLEASNAWKAFKSSSLSSFA